MKNSRKTGLGWQNLYISTTFDFIFLKQITNPLALGLTYGLPNYTAYTGYAESHCANHINADAL
mgnify:CR=1 FL=1